MSSMLPRAERARFTVMTRLALVLLAPLVLLAGVRTAAACDCAWPGRPCRALDDTPVVFSGRALAIGTLKSGQGGEQRRVRFEVLQPFKGISGRYP